MNFRRPSNQFNSGRKKRFPRGLIGVMVVIAVLVGINALTTGGLSRSVFAVAEPLWKTQAGVGGAFYEIKELLKSKRVLIEENSNLKDELSRQLSSQAEIRVLKQENLMLRDTLNRKEEREQVAGVVLTRPNRSLYDTIVVDVGWKHGVSKDARVFAHGNIAIGTVVEVYPSSSLVSLFSSPGRISDVLIGDDGHPAQAIGKGGGNFEIQLPRGVAVFKYDPVIIPSLGTDIFGVVEEIISNPADPFQTILFSAPVNIQSIKVVTIDV